MRNFLPQKLTLTFSLAFLATFALAQDGRITGRVTDAKGEALVGASAIIKGATKGATANKDGVFTIDNLANGTYTVVVSAIGFTTKEVPATVPGDAGLRIAMTETASDLEEVVVTGVFDRRTRMESSVAISTLNTRQLEAVVPNSAADLLKYLPGVYVNTSRGEVGNAVYTRGLNFGGGFFYVSMQEDGLPIMGITGLVNPDGYLRADATVQRVEGVRGGTASILGPNAPGGIFNYVSKTGGTQLAGEVRARVGLEGNGRNPYYRTDFNVGGPLSANKSLTFNIGGFYRYANGAKYPGYPLSYGGQVKANIVKNYKWGSVRLYGKFLDDNTAPFEFTPTVDFTNPRPAGNFTNSSSTLIQSQQFTVPGATTGGYTIDYDTRKVNAYNETAGGLLWEQQFGTGWTFTNNFKLSGKDFISQTTSVVFPFRVDQPTFYGVSGNIPRFGTYNFYDPATGQSYGTVQQLPPAGAGQPLRFIPANLNLPGGEVLPNALFYNPNPYADVRMSDFINQASLTKRFNKMSFTGGLYYSSTQAERLTLIPSAQSFATIEDKPKAVGIRYTNLAGATFDLTNASGITNLGGSGAFTNDARIRQTAFFFGHNWQITDKLNFDWGLRTEKFVIDSKFTVPRRLPDNPTGGADGNLSTLYDVRVWQNGPQQEFNKDLNTLSYSAGLNYQVNSGLAFYGRYSQGRKSPDLSFFMDIANQQLTSSIAVEAQSIQMAELGLKLRRDKLNAFVTPFYTRLGSVPNFQIFQNPDLTYYAPSRVYQKFRTAGVELEGNYQFTPQFSLRAVGVFQQSKALEYAVYLAKANGPADDERVTFNGNYNDNIGTMLTITPTYTLNKFVASLTYQYMGKRWANVGNAFELPAFGAFDLNLSYRLNAHLQLNGSINNVLNTYGIMGWAAPGGFPAALDTQGFTAQMLEANPNAIYATLPIMPRAYFLTASYKF